MKSVDLDGSKNLQLVRGGTDEWYWSMDYTSGDLYEAEELFQMKHKVECNRLYLIHYPDGRVYGPIPRAKGRYLGEPVYDHGAIAILMVDFAERMIHILRFDPASGETTETARLPLSSVKDCYNLLLHTSPLMLTRQANDNIFEIIWPERVRFPIGDTESFNFREGGKLYFTAWYEDPEYREETVVRALRTGEILERFPGDIRIMPNGDKWHLK